MNLIKVASAAFILIAQTWPALSQTEVVSRITAPLVRTFHTNLYVSAGQSRGFTRNPDPNVARKPAGEHDKARDYIYSRLLEMGAPVRLVPFSFTTSFGTSPNTYHYEYCNNIIVTIPGVNPAGYGAFIISAFYDTIDRGQPLPINMSSGPAPRSPGADLNASGVAALLAVAEAISQERFMSTIVLAFFDASEKNFGGSYQYVRTRTTWNAAKTNKLYRGNIRGMISLDTIGYNPWGPTYNTAAMWGGSNSITWLRKKLAKAVRDFGGIQTIHYGSINCSDHVPFFQAGIDSCVLSERNIWNNPYTYTELDSITKANYMDYNYLAGMARGVAGFLARYAVLARQLSLSVSGSGILTGGPGHYPSGTIVPLEAHPSPGWRLAGWAGDTNDCLVIDSMLIVPMTQQRSIQARFAELLPEESE